jgi:hypothetical protein
MQRDRRKCKIKRNHFISQHHRLTPQKHVNDRSYLALMSILPLFRFRFAEDALDSNSETAELSNGRRPPRRTPGAILSCFD